MWTIKNDNLVLSVSEKGAEVHSLKKVNEDYDYAWEGDKTYWAGRNPILFPQVSSNDDKTMLINGVTYKTGNHGFARNAVFKLAEDKGDELVLKLSENEDTLSQYPFKFELLVDYKLNGNRVDITYTITNNDEKDMPFGFGLHPAFNVDKDYKDTYVTFNKAEEGFGERIDISKELFEKYPTVIINKPEADVCTLYSNNHALAVEYKGFNIFAIWSQGPFVCLEPWMSWTAKDDHRELKDRDNIKILKPNEKETYKYSWIVVK